MKTVVYEDTRGYKRRVMLPDNVDESEAELGIPLSLPIIDMIDWDVLKTAVNNIIVEEEVTDWNSLQRSLAIERILSAVKRHIISAVRSQENG